MADLTTGDLLLSRDFPATASNLDDTILTELSNTSYAAGSPEVGVYFTAPTTGRVVITVGGGLRDSGGVDRVFLSPQVFSGDVDGTEVLAPSVTNRGFGSSAPATEFHYASRTSLLTGLTAGAVYYARVMHVIAAGGASPAGTADINSREITVVPAP